MLFRFQQPDMLLEAVYCSPGGQQSLNTSNMQSVVPSDRSLKGLASNSFGFRSSGFGCRFRFWVSSFRVKPAKFFPSRLEQSLNTSNIQSVAPSNRSLKGLKVWEGGFCELGMGCVWDGGRGCGAWGQAHRNAHPPEEG